MKLKICVLFLVLLSGCQYLAPQGIKITSPKQGAKVKPDSTLRVYAVCPMGTDIVSSYAVVDTGHSRMGSQTFPCPYGIFQFHIPADAHGKINILLLGGKGLGKGSLVGDVVTLQVGF